MKKLIVVQIVHSEADMGSMKGLLKEKYIEKFGKSQWEAHVSLIDKFWGEVRIEIMKLELDYGRLHIYQDGLPLCGKEAQIVKEVAGQGSENYRIIVDLMEKGAILEGTEDPKLLMEEYQHLKEEGEAFDPERTERAGGRLDEILTQRDLFIAGRIEETLGDGETGILFIGLKHAIEDALSPDSEIIPLIGIERT